MPYRTVALEALAAWREAETCLADCEEDSAEWQEAFVAAESAKQRYQDAVDAAQAANLPEPPPFSEASKPTPEA